MRPGRSEPNEPGTAGEGGGRGITVTGGAGRGQHGHPRSMANRNRAPTTGVRRNQPGDVRSAVVERARDGGAVDQGRQAGGEDDPAILSPLSLQRGAAGVEPAGLQPGELVAATGAAVAD